MIKLLYQSFSINSIGVIVLKNIYDYLDYYGDVSFDEMCFQEVDSLIFSLLSYAKFESIVPKFKKDFISLKEACLQFLKVHKKDYKKEDWLYPIVYPIIERLSKSVRFQNVKCYHFVNYIDENGQFGAVTFRFNGITYISYEGTDSSVVGWKEDLEMIYQYPIASQKKAVDYFNDTLNVFDRMIYIGGHSKGGNLAMYAYLNGKSYYKGRVKQVYNFDGPGFFDDVLQTDAYQEMCTKLTTIVPSQSIVGMCLEHIHVEAISSSSFSIMQHDASTWEVFGGKFVTCDLSKQSERLNQNLKQYISDMNLEERKQFVETSFAVFEKSKITNIMQLKDFNIATLLSIMKEIKNIPSNTKRNFVAIIRLLITSMR